MAFIPASIPVFQLLTNAGVIAPGYKLFTYLAGTSTKTNTWSDNGSTLNSNPIILDSNGRCKVFLSSSVTYKFVFAPSNDTDPPTSPIWTVDNIGSLSSSNIVDNNGNIVISPLGVSTPVNYLTVTNSATGNPVLINSAGSDTNIGLTISTKGTGAINLNSASNPVLTLQGVATGVNCITVTNSIAGAAPSLVTTGSDTNIGLTISTKGAGELNLTVPGASNINLNTRGGSCLQVTGSGTVVNYIQIIGSSTGGGPRIYATGSDTNVPLIFSGKGTSGTSFYGAAGTIQIASFLAGASNANFFTFTASATGSPITVAATGSDTNIGLTISTKGTGTLTLAGGSGNTSITGAVITSNASTNNKIQVNSLDSLIVNGVASAVNQLTTTNSTTGNKPSVSATGSDSNISLLLSSKGTGSVDLSSPSSTTVAKMISTSGTAQFIITGNSTVTIPAGTFTLGGGLAVWARCNNVGSVLSGYNIASASHPATGQFSYTFTNAISSSSAPIVDTDQNTYSSDPVVTTTTISFLIYNSGGAAVDVPFSFCIFA